MLVIKAAEVKLLRRSTNCDISVTADPSSVSDDVKKQVVCVVKAVAVVNIAADLQSKSMKRKLEEFLSKVES